MLQIPQVKMIIHNYDHAEDPDNNYHKTLRRLTGLGLFKNRTEREAVKRSLHSHIFGGAYNV